MYNLETNIFKRIKLLNEENRILIITDDNIYNLYNDNLKNYKILVIDSGENSKSIENVQKILKYLLINKYNRKDTLLVGFGGGVIGDLTGFVASIYMRGIKYVQIPTTLLAMVDSSIGGKTGINFNNIKNSVGTFYKPENIYLHFNFLDKLPREEIINGWAEILKIILISSKKLWNFIKVHNIDYFLENPSKFNEIIEISAKLKFDIVNSDYKEQLNKRIYLNFGHTIGHAIESLTLMKHGYCVAIGMLKEIELGNLNYEVINEIKNVFRNYELPIVMPNLDNELIINIIENDKKNNDIIILKEIGEPKIVTWNKEIIRNILTDKRLLEYQNTNNDYVELMAPSSKSETNRILILYSLGNKKYKINNILISDDTVHMIDSLIKLGVYIKIENNSVYIHGNGGKFYSKGEINIGNSGTCMRFLTSLISFLCENDCIITGDSYMKKRPIDDLVKSLIDFGIRIEYLENEGYPPIKIYGKFNDTDKDIKIKTIKSSQYVSGLLMVLPYFRDIKLSINSDIVSYNFIKLTINMMKEFGINLNSKHSTFNINKQEYNLIDNYNVQADATSVIYPLVAGALLNKKVKILNLNTSNIQGDIKYSINLLSDLGYNINFNDKFTLLDGYKEIKNKELVTNVDMDSSDTFITISLLSGFLNSKYRIHNIDNQNLKECPRIDLTYKYLYDCGFNIERIENDLIINGRKDTLEAIYIDCFDDHRIAMSFSLLSIFIPNIIISNYKCVNKTYPNFWEDIKKFGLNLKIPYSNSGNIELKDKYVLIGMPTSGKTTLSLGLEEIPRKDTDLYFENKFNIPVSEYIINNGMDKFRDEEIKIYKEIINSNTKVISTGGGIIENNLFLELSKNINIIHIDRDINDIKTNYELRDDKVININEAYKKRDYFRLANFYFYNYGKNTLYFSRWFSNLNKKIHIPFNSYFLCLNVKNIKDNINKIIHDSENVNVIEVRVDLLESYDKKFIAKEIHYLKENINKPTIYTVRTISEGGKYPDDPRDLLLFGKKIGCEIIDVEMQYPINIPNVTIIGSVHGNDFKNKISTSYNIVKPDIIKVVTDNKNNNSLSEFLNNYKIGKKIILFTGEDGPISRVKNNFLTPVCSILNKTFSEQLTYEEIAITKKILKYPILQKYGLFGSYINNSPSPFLHNYNFKEFNLNAIYNTYSKLTPKQVIDTIKNKKLNGASITRPFKESIMPFLDIIDPIATKIGSINTINIKDGLFYGYNTDWIGIQNILNQLHFKNIIILGSGGTAKAAAYAINKLNYKFKIFSRNKETRRFISKDYNVESYDLQKFYNYDVIVNCLPPEVNVKYKGIMVNLSYNKKTNDYAHQILKEQAKEQFKIWFNINEEFYDMALHKYIMG